MTISKKTNVRILAIKLITFLTEQGYGWDVNKMALDKVRGIKEDKDEWYRKPGHMDDKEDRGG